MTVSHSAARSTEKEARPTQSTLLTAVQRLARRRVVRQRTTPPSEEHAEEGDTDVAVGQQRRRTGRRRRGTSSSRRTCGRETWLGPEVTEERVDDRLRRPHRAGRRMPSGAARGPARPALRPGRVPPRRGWVRARWAPRCRDAAAGAVARWWSGVGVVGRGAGRRPRGVRAAYGGVGPGERGRTARRRAPLLPLGRRDGGDRPAVQLAHPAGDGEPDARSPPPASSPEPKRSKMRWACSAGMPRPSSATRSHQRSGPSGPALTVTRPPGGLCRSALSSRLASTWARRAASAVTCRSAGTSTTWTVPRRETPASATARLDEARGRRRPRARGASRPPSTAAEVEQVADERRRGVRPGRARCAARRRRDARRRRRGSRAGPAGRRAACAARGRPSRRAGVAAGRRRRGRPPWC